MTTLVDIIFFYWIRISKLTFKIFVFKQNIIFFFKILFQKSWYKHISTAPPTTTHGPFAMKERKWERKKITIWIRQKNNYLFMKFNISLLFIFIFLSNQIRVFSFLFIFFFQSKYTIEKERKVKSLFGGNPTKPYEQALWNVWIS